MTDELISRTEGPARVLVLNRPARRNALTPELARALANAVEEAGQSDDVRAVVITGAGGHFCAGLDLHWLPSLGSEPTVGAMQRGLADFQSAVLAVVLCPVPVIALMAGTAAGFGLDLALACDIRVAAQSAAFTSAFARMGLVPDGGSTLTLPLLVGLGRALRFLLAGETVTADAALGLGLVSEVTPDAELETAGRRLVEAIAAGAPASIRAIKRLCRATELGSLEQALSSEGAAQLQALSSADFRQRLAAFTARTGANR